MPPRAFLYLVLSNVLGGTSYAAAAYALRGFSPEAAVFWRTLAGGLLFAALLAARRPPLPVDREDWLRIGAVGSFGYALPLLLGNWGQKLSTATNAALLVGVEPLSIVVLSALFLREPLTWLKAGAVAAGLAGSALLVLQGFALPAGLSPHLEGDLLLLAHSVCWSLYTVIGKPALKRVDPLVFTGLTILIGLGPMGAAAWPTLIPAVRPGLEVWAAQAYLAVGVTFLGTLLWNKALEEVPASQLANFIFLQPLVGVVLGVFLHGDAFSRWSASGGALILAGVWAATREQA